MRTYQELIEELAVLRAQIDDVLSAIAELRKENINQFTLRAVVILLVVAYLGSSFGTFGVIYLTCAWCFAQSLSVAVACVASSDAGIHSYRLCINVYTGIYRLRSTPQSQKGCSQIDFSFVLLHSPTGEDQAQQ
jgi:hypothetical protein